MTVLFLGMELLAAGLPEATDDGRRTANCFLVFSAGIPCGGRMEPTGTSGNVCDGNNVQFSRVHHGWTNDRGGGASEAAARSNG